MDRAKRRFPNPRPLSPERNCGACGHALGDLPLNQPCPACGWRPSVRCITCGYDLAGLDAEGACPECSTRVAESVRGDGLVYAAPAYLRTLDRGLAMIRWSVGLVLITWLGGMFVLIAISASGVQVPSWVENAVISGLMLASLVLYALGWWTATGPDPRTPEGQHPRSAIIARYGGAAMLAAVALLLVLGSILLRAREIILPVLLLLVLVQHGGGSFYLRHLSNAAANARATRYAKQAVVAILVVAGARVLDLGLDLLGIQKPAGQSTMAISGRLAFSLLGLAIFVAAIVAIARQFTSAGLLREDLKRFLHDAKPLG